METICRYFLLLIAMTSASIALAAVPDFPVQAACYWSSTGIRVEKGRHYRVEIVDMSSVKDSEIRVANLDGWPPSIRRTIFTVFGFWMRRRPFDPWFSIIATVERRYPQRLREGQDYVAPATGELVCFFNDACWAYGNNFGVAYLRLIPES